MIVHYVANHADKGFTTVGDSAFVPERYGIAVKKGNAALLEHLNAGLAAVRADGSYASGVVGNLPTVTYPSHVTLLTGVAPARHGIVNNTTFDPQQNNQGGWYWYASDITAPTLWDAAAKGWGRGAQCEMTLTFDHRVADGAVAARYDEAVSLPQHLALANEAAARELTNV